MSKTHRGRGLRAQPAHGRGVCPICHKDNIKVLYEQEINGQKVKICKYCKAALKNKALKNKASGTTAAAPAANAAPATETAPAAAAPAAN